MTNAYQQGEYDHVHVAIDGDVLTLTREKGTSIQPTKLIWSRAEPVTAVRIDDETLPFETTAEGVLVLLPALEDSLTVEVE
jgi:hypothetical protein